MSWTLDISSFPAGLNRNILSIGHLMQFPSTSNNGFFSFSFLQPFFLHTSVHLSFLFYYYFFFVFSYLFIYLYYIHFFFVPLLKETKLKGDFFFLSLQPFARAETK